jgi:hypothetical protein
MKRILILGCYLLAQKSFAYASHIETRSLDCKIQTSTGQSQSATVTRELWKVTRDGSMFEKRSFIASDDLAKVMEADYGRNIGWSIGSTSTRLDLPQSTTQLSMPNESTTSESSIAYLGEVNSRLQIKSQMTTSYRSIDENTTQVNIIIEDIGFYGDTDEFIKTYKREFNLDIAPSSFNLKKIQYSGFCKNK